MKRKVLKEKEWMDQDLVEELEVIEYRLEEMLCNGDFATQIENRKEIENLIMPILDISEDLKNSSAIACMMNEILQFTKYLMADFNTLPKKEYFNSDPEFEGELFSQDEKTSSEASIMHVKKWDKIFGLEQAKQALIETFCYPLKFPELFKDNESLQKAFYSIIIYGPPGMTLKIPLKIDFAY